MPLLGAAPDHSPPVTFESLRPRTLATPHPDAWLSMMLASGGDERLRLDPRTERNRYGVPAGPAEGELWFSSSTASAISPRGWRAARQALASLTDPAAWMDDIRARLQRLYGVPGGQCVLSASGTESELIVLALARGLLGGAITNLVAAPGETGSGVACAADGRHFLGHASLGGPVPRGHRLAGWEDADIHVGSVEIRQACGTVRPEAVVDADAETQARQALAVGRAVLLHMLDCSKTGLPGVSRAAARRIAELDPRRVLVVVDACQLRCDAAQVRADLAAGFAVMITGSKFAGGPAFCGALLLPPTWTGRLDGAAPLPPGLAAYAARLDWPAALRPGLADNLQWPVNLGLGLRWSAALAEIEAYEALAPALPRQVLDAFQAAALRAIAAAPTLAPLPGVEGQCGSILPILCDRPAETVREAWRLMAEPGPAGDLRAPCHLGQPVIVGGAAVLRLCASMPMIGAVAARMANGLALAPAMAPLLADLDRAFARLTLALDQAA